MCKCCADQKYSHRKKLYDFPKKEAHDHEHMHPDEDRPSEEYHGAFARDESTEGKRSEGDQSRERPIDAVTD